MGNKLLKYAVVIAIFIISFLVISKAILNQENYIVSVLNHVQNGEDISIDSEFVESIKYFYEYPENKGIHPPEVYIDKVDDNTYNIDFELFEYNDSNRLLNAYSGKVTLELSREFLHWKISKIYNFKKYH